MDSEPLCEVTPLIIAYENPVALSYTLISLLQWGFLPSVITVFDNGSSPDAKKAILAFSSENGCHTVDSPVNHGWGGAINIFLECHDNFPGESILLVMAHDAFFVSLDRSEIQNYFIDPKTIFVIPSYPKPLTSHYSILKSYYTREGIAEGLINIGHQTAFFARRQLLASIQYDEEYWLYGDEFEIFTRARKAGFLTYQAVRTTIVNPSSDSSSEFSMLAYKLNSLYTAFKRHGYLGLMLRASVIFVNALCFRIAGDLKYSSNIINLLRYSLANPGKGLRSYRKNAKFHVAYPIGPLVPVSKDYFIV